MQLLCQTTPSPPVSHFAAESGHLASSRAGDVRALATLYTTSNRVARPGPVAAGALRTEDVDRDSLAGDSAGHTLDSQAGDGDTSSGGASRRAVLVVLLDDDTVLGDLQEWSVHSVL